MLAPRSAVAEEGKDRGTLTAGGRLLVRLSMRKGSSSTPQRPSRWRRCSERIRRSSGTIVDVDLQFPAHTVGLEVPSMTASAMARALFEEASHGLDIGSGTRSAKRPWDHEPMFNTGTEPRMQQFERELADVLPPPDGN